MMNISDTMWNINPNSLDYLTEIFSDPYTSIAIKMTYSFTRQVYILSYQFNIIDRILNNKLFLMILHIPRQELLYLE